MSEPFERWAATTGLALEQEVNGWMAKCQKREAELQALTNNVERAIAILTPLFVQAQDQDDPYEEPIGNALDVLHGWFGQNGQPLRKPDADAS